MEPLYTTETTYTLEEYKRFAHTVQRRIGHLPVAIAVLLVMLVLLWLLTDEWGFLLGAALSVPAVIVMLELQLRRAYASNRAVQGNVTHYSFYEDRFESDSPLGHTQMQYEMLYRVLETRTHFYLMLGKNQGAIIVKAHCTPELIEHIRTVAARAGRGGKH